MADAAAKKSTTKKEEPKAEESKKEEMKVEDSKQASEDSPQTSPVAAYVNMREGYNLWGKLRVTDEDKKLLQWSNGLEPAMRNYWYDMEFDIVYTSMFGGKPYEIQFVKECESLDCKMIFPDRIDEPYEFGMLTLGYHKRMVKSDQKHQQKDTKRNAQLYIKPGPTYYQKEDLDQEKLQGLQTPVGKWLIAQTICDHVFFKVIMSCEYTRLPKIQCLLNKEPMIRRGKRSLQYRKIAHFA